MYMEKFNIIRNFVHADGTHNHGSIVSYKKFIYENSERSFEQGEVDYEICKDKYINSLKCVTDYIYQCVGNQKIVDVVFEGETIYQVFENGHYLPILCSHCGKSLKTDDLYGLHKKLLLRILEDISSEEIETDNDCQVTQVNLIYSKRNNEKNRLVINVALYVSINMKHPFKCPNGNIINPQISKRTSVSRNDPCNCGSGLKFKKCCGK